MMSQAITTALLLLAATLVQSDVMFNFEGGEGDGDSEPHVDIAEMYFRCKNATLISLDESQVCDGFDHCPDGEDEMDEACLQIDQCPGGRYKCPTEHKCIGHSQLCDGTIDCHSSSWDESLQQCPSTANPAECQPGYFKCRAATMEYPSATVCVPTKSKCNFNNDCIDGSDEEAATCPPNSRQCPTGMFRCYITGDYGDLSVPFRDMCIERKDVCNGVNDCFHGEDETDKIDDCRIEERYEIARRRIERNFHVAPSTESTAEVENGPVTNEAETDAETQNTIEDTQGQGEATDAQHHHVTPGEIAKAAQQKNSASQLASSTTILLLVALAIY